MKYYLLAAGLSVVLIVGTVHLSKMERLQTDNDRLQQALQHSEDKTDGYELLIQWLATDLVQQRASQQQLLETQNQLSAAADSRAQIIRSLQRENQELKSWADVVLPGPVQCLRNRPALANAADYTAWLSGSGTLQPACP